MERRYLALSIEKVNIDLLKIERLCHQLDILEIKHLKMKGK